MAKKMTELVRLLRQSHAIEVGAYHAYEGHWRSLPEGMAKEHIKEIQQDEAIHRNEISKMLKSLDGKPSIVQDAIFWVIGTIISLSCYVIGYRAAMYGAKIMEKMGSVCYYRVGSVAYDSGHTWMGSKLVDMGHKEKEHEDFFELCLELRRLRK